MSVKIDLGIDFVELMQMIEHMLELQLIEDTLVHKERNTSYPDLLDKYFPALLDEFGEFIHELKPEWCWWKKDKGTVNKEKVLEEFADVTHFILSFCLALHNGAIEEVFKAASYLNSYNRFYFYEKDDVSYLIASLLKMVVEPDDADAIDILLYWANLIFILDFDFKTEVYEPYIKKNAVNQQRVRTGY